jgi:hypothetical protein
VLLSERSGLPDRRSYPWAMGRSGRDDGHAKPRSSDEINIFPKEIPGRAGGAARRPRPSGATATPSAWWARMHAGARAQGRRPGRAREPGVLASGQGVFPGAGFGNQCMCLLLLLAYNYIHQLRTKPQRHEGTKDAQRDSWRSPAWRFLRATGSSPGQPAGPRSEPPGSRLLLVDAHTGRAVRACSDIVRAGWLAWRAIVSMGKRPVEV